MKNLFILLLLTVTTDLFAQNNDNSTGFSQNINVSAYAGKKFKLEAAARLESEDKKAGAVLFFSEKLKGDKPGRSVSTLDNQVKDPNWKPYSLNGTLSGDVENLSIGAACIYSGHFFFDAFKLSVEIKEGQWQTIELKNAGFEDLNFEKFRPIGWSFQNDIPATFKFQNSNKQPFEGKNALEIIGKVESDDGIDAFLQMRAWAKENYEKMEFQIPMRDGIKLFTKVYMPKDASATKTYPFVMERTCYSVGPYGTEFGFYVGPEAMVKEKYIFVNQDVRGRYMSEGQWTNMTPHNPQKKSSTDVDESSDAYDTIDWLLKNIKNNNGKVGMMGISYPGFYASASSIDAHPALKAVSPQAPVADFFFDDFHHNGAFTQGYLLTMNVFGVQKDKPSETDWYPEIKPNTKDGYEFNKRVGALKNASKYYGADNFIWKELAEHPNYDDFWQKRRITTHFNNLKPAYLVVGGWYDAEDLYGALTTYKTIEKNNPSVFNMITMGPFGHGNWAWEQGHSMHHDMYFGDSLATFYQREIEAKFFHHFLKTEGNSKIDLPEAYMFDTGKKEYQKFDSWKPKNTTPLSFFLKNDEKLSFEKPNDNTYSEYISDPKKPVPYTMDILGSNGFTPRNYMSEDQRFAANRPDVLVFQMDTLTEDLTLAGDIDVELFVTTTGTDADWVVKLIDVFPDNEPNTPHTPKHITLNGYQHMVRSEVMRGRFRNSFEKPEPMIANEITPIRFKLQDVLHTFKKGHRLMVQVQSTWFPLIDRNPQKYVPNIYKADDADFIKATHRVYHSASNASKITVFVLK